MIDPFFRAFVVQGDQSPRVCHWRHQHLPTTERRAECVGPEQTIRAGKDELAHFTIPKLFLP
jgi:hypothetical protein